MAESSHIVTLKSGTTTINGVQSIGGMGVKADMADVTALTDTWHRRLPVLLDGGEPDVELDYDPDDASQAALITACTGKATATYNIILGGAATETWSFVAYVSDFRPAPKKGEKLSATVKFSVDGAVSVAHA